MGTHSDIPLPAWPCELVICLVEPQYDGNIGAVARAMRNFGLEDLRIVRHDGQFSEETRNRAKHAQVVLDGARCGDWDDVLDDCSLVIGTSGKRETGTVQFRHFLLPNEMGERLNEIEGKGAIVFGPEGMGLTQAELGRCDLLLTIPTWEGYPSLNLSHTVAIVCYEWYQTLLPRIGREKALPKTVQTRRILDPALKEQIRMKADGLAQASKRRRDDQKAGVAEVISRVILRGMPTNEEAHRLLGILDEAIQALED